MPDSFVMYRSFVEALQSVDTETRLAVYDALSKYALDGIEPDLNGIAAALFALMRPQIDANNKRRENGKLGAVHGAKGGRPKKHDNPTGDTNKNPYGVIEENPTETPNVNDNDNVNVNGNGKRNKPAHLCRPSLEDVRAYCLERNNNVDPEAFVDFYTSKGWKVGSQPMKDWQAAVRQWERRQSGNEQKVAPLREDSFLTMGDLYGNKKG